MASVYSLMARDMLDQPTPEGSARRQIKNVAKEVITYSSLSALEQLLAVFACVL